MSMNRFSLPAVTALALIPVPALSAAPGGMLVETQMSDPDPGYVPPPVRHEAASKPHTAKNPTLDEAFENLGRAAGEAAQVMQRRAIDRLKADIAESQMLAETAKLKRMADQSAKEAGN